jgi:hypothetical protein
LLGCQNHRFNLEKAGANTGAAMLSATGINSGLGLLRRAGRGPYGLNLEAAVYLMLGRLRAGRPTLPVQARPPALLAPLASGGGRIR